MFQHFCGILRDPAGDGQGAGGANGSTGSAKPAPGGQRDASQARSGTMTAGEVHSVLAERFGQRPTHSPNPTPKKPQLRAVREDGARPDDDSRLDDGQQQEEIQQDESQRQDDGSQADDSPEHDDGQQPEDSEQDDSGEQDGGEQGEDGQDDGVEFTPEQQEVFNKRLGKEVRKRKEAEKELLKVKTDAETHLKTAQQATAELQKLAAQKLIPVPTPQVPLTNVSNQQQLDQLAAEARNFKRWLQRNPEGGACPLLVKDGQPVQLTADQVRDRLATAEDILEMEIPARSRYLAEEAKFEDMARKYLPELANPASVLSSHVNQVYAAFPQIKLLPHHKVAAAQFALGAMLFQKLGAGAYAHVEKLAPGGKPATATATANGKAPARKPPAALGARGGPRGDPAKKAADDLRSRLGSGKATTKDVRAVLRDRFGGLRRTA